MKCSGTARGGAPGVRHCTCRAMFSVTFFRNSGPAGRAGAPLHLTTGTRQSLNNASEIFNLPGSLVARPDLLSARSTRHERPGRSPLKPTIKKRRQKRPFLSFRSGWNLRPGPDLTAHRARRHHAVSSSFVLSRLAGASFFGSTPISSISSVLRAFIFAPSDFRSSDASFLTFGNISFSSSFT